MPTLSAATPPSRWWVDPATPGINRMPAHTLRQRFDSTKDAALGTNPRQIDLSTGWHFALVHRPEDAPQNFMHPDFEDRSWHRISVPHQWTLGPEGEFHDAPGRDNPHYTNVQMPWLGEPPHVPNRNPTGLYRIPFVPPSGPGERCIVHFGGAESALAVWVNGHFVGTHKDSRLPAEFDITEHLERDGNILAAMVVRWSDGTWIEDQDHWYMAGLHRRVYLSATPETALADVQIDAVLQQDLRSGTLDFAVPVRFANGPTPGWSVAVDIRRPDDENSVFFSAQGKVPIPRATTATGREIDSVTFRGTTARFQHRAENVDGWSAEKPTLYRGVVSLIRPDGQLAEAVPVSFGFTRVEVRDRELLLNGCPVLIYGVNRHDHHPDRGKALSPDDIREDIRGIKRLGFNALRCAHYPNDPLVLELCDEFGLYVIDEANVECHARAGEVAHMPEFETAILDRVARMVRRDRNHPSVFAWSLGNESGYAPVHDAAAAWVRAVQPNRVVHYEGAMRYSSWHETAGLGAAASDLVCPMYPTLDQIRRWAALDDPRPFIMCEYTHAMGNSNGGLDAYWDLIESTPGLQGGFIWDWKDQGLTATAADGTPLWAFGGHFGDEPNDANFNCNGIVGPDGVPHPGAIEHQYLARPVDIAVTDDGEVELTNRRWFSDLSDLSARWMVSCGSATLAAGTVDVPHLDPQSTASLPIDELSNLDASRPDGGHSTLLTVIFETLTETPWAPSGTVIASVQRELAAPRELLQLHPPTDTPVVATGTLATVASGDGSIQVSFDIASTQLVAVQVGGRALAMTTPSLSVWRPPTDNDGIKQGWSAPPREHVPLKARQIWMRDGLAAMRISRRDMTATPTAVVIETDWVAAHDDEPIRHRQTVRSSETGVVFEEQVEVPDVFTDLPRIGVRFQVAAPSHLRWLGAGPHETYPDRMASARFGVWEAAIADQYVPFVVPQEHGFHCDSRWFELAEDDSSGSTPMVRCDLLGTAGFSALHHSAEDLTNAMHLGELSSSPQTHVHIDATMRGLGTAACGPDTGADFIVGSGRYEFGWAICRGGTA